MNLCFINPSRSLRPEIYGLAENLPKKYRIVILQPSDNVEMRNNFYFRENVVVKPVPSIFTHISDSTVTLPVPHIWVRELLDVIRLEKIDLIQVCDYEYLTSLIPIFIKRLRAGIPSVIVNDALLGVENYSFGSRLIDLLSEVYTYSLGLNVLKSYDRVIFLYKKLARCSRKLGLPEEKIRIIPNGIDMRKIFEIRKKLDASSLRRKYGIAEDEKVILYVGRLVKAKRVEILIKLIKKLLRKNLKVKGLIVGDGPRRSELEEIARPFASHIKFTGYLSKEKFECYCIADLFVLPSISEGLPTVLLEAAAFELPIIATNIYGVPDIVIHGKTGFLINRWDHNRYIEYAEYLLMNQGFARKMGENAREHVANNFSWHKIVKEYEKIYEELSLS